MQTYMPSKHVLDEAERRMQAILAIDEDDFKRASDDEDYLAELIIPIMTGCPLDVFVHIDEKCDYGVPFARRFWMLRRVRNRYGERLFAVLKKD